MKSCTTCNYFGNTEKCLRSSFTKDDPIYGKVITHRSARFERSWLWRALGLDTCGPNAYYWVEYRRPKPPKGGSAVKPRGSPPGRVS